MSLGPIRRKSAPAAITDRGLGHHVLVVDVGVGEDDLIHLEVSDQVREIAFGIDRDSFRIELPRQFGGIAAAVDVRDLRGGERDDLVAGVAPEEGVEVVEIAPCGAHDQHACLGHDRCSSAVGSCQARSFALSISRCGDAIASHRDHRGLRFDNRFENQGRGVTGASLRTLHATKRGDRVGITDRKGQTNRCAARVSYQLFNLAPAY